MIIDAKYSGVWKAAAFWALVVLWASLSFSSALAEVAFAAALVLWLGRHLSARSAPWPRLTRGVWVPLAVFVLVSVSSVVWSDLPDRSVRGIFKTLQQILMFLMAADLFGDARSSRRFETVLAVTAWIAAVNCFWQIAYGADILRGFKIEASSAGPRVSGSFKTYGHLAVYLTLTVPTLAALAWGRWKESGKRMQSVVFGAAAAAGVVLLFLTRSRGGYVAFAAGLVFWIAMKRKFLLLALLILAAAAGIGVLPRGMVIHLDAEGKEQSLVERFYLWDRAVQVIKAKPLTGTGINTYAAVHARYDKRQNWRVKGYYAHNGYLQMAAEIGLPGVCAFLAFLLMYFRSSLRALRGRDDPGAEACRALLAGLCGFLVFSAGDTALHNPMPVMTFWYLAGFQWACAHRTRSA